MAYVFLLIHYPIFIPVLTSEKQVEFYLHTLPSLVRMCKAFPPLCEDTVNLLMHLGRICRANLATSSVTMINSTGEFNFMCTVFLNMDILLNPIENWLIFWEIHLGPAVIWPSIKTYCIPQQQRQNRTAYQIFNIFVEIDCVVTVWYYHSQ